jgi:hypothetical protein
MVHVGCHRCHHRRTIDMSQKFTVARLEQALCAWEEIMWATRVLCEGFVAGNLEPPRPLMGALLHHQELREHLASVRSIDEFDTERFTAPLDEGERTGEIPLGSQEFFPLALAHWCVGSRRVYHIDEDLQTLLMRMSCRRLTRSAFNCRYLFLLMARTW